MLTTADPYEELKLPLRKMLTAIKQGQPAQQATLAAMYSLPSYTCAYTIAFALEEIIGSDKLERAKKEEDSQ